MVRSAGEIEGIVVCVRSAKLLTGDGEVGVEAAGAEGFGAFMSDQNRLQFHSIATKRHQETQNSRLLVAIPAFSSS
jgi:hypothetical protein